MWLRHIIHNVNLRARALKFRPKPKLGVLATNEAIREGNAPNPSHGG
jgi:hypothetical protein